MSRQALYHGTLIRSSLTHQVIRKCNDELKLLSDQGEMSAPFQFAIPIMAAMYDDFQARWFLSQENGENVISNLRQKLTQKRPPWGKLDPPLANQLPAKSPIRAIAYFSWEESTRVFLARRVYPTYFNFLSYSHCSEQWGALGAMVEQLRKRKGNYFKCTGKSAQYGLTQITRFSQAALPFMAEVERINYNAIFAIPVVEKREDYLSTNSLLGGFLVFLENKNYMPKAYLRSRRDFLKFAEWVKSTTSLFKITLDRQHAIFFPNEDGKDISLASHWRERIKKHRGLDVYELKVSTTRCALPSSLDAIISDIMASLSNSEFHAIVDQNHPEKDCAVLLIATAKGINQEIVKPGILRAVGVACEIPSMVTLTLRKL